jgi:hypothetical protein
MTHDNHSGDHPSELYVIAHGAAVLLSRFENKGDPIPSTLVSKSLSYIFDDFITQAKIDGVPLVNGAIVAMGKDEDILDFVINKVKAIDSESRPTIVLTAADHDKSALLKVRDSVDAARTVAPVIVIANAEKIKQLFRKDTEAGTLEESCGKASELYCSFSYNPVYPVTFVVTNGKDGVHIINKDTKDGKYDLPNLSPKLKEMISDDGFVDGYMIGALYNLSLRECVELGLLFVKAQAEARLNPKKEIPKLDRYVEWKNIHRDVNEGYRDVNLEGPFTRLDLNNPAHNTILMKLLEAMSIRTHKEIETKEAVSIGTRKEIKMKPSVKDLFKIVCQKLSARLPHLYNWRPHITNKPSAAQVRVVGCKPVQG